LEIRSGIFQYTSIVSLHALVNTPPAIHQINFSALARGVKVGFSVAASLLTQIFTRGKSVSVLAEATLHLRLDRTLVLKPRT
jgi:hypothetical protein